VNVAIKTLNRIAVLPRSFIQPLVAKSYMLISILAITLLLTSFGIICIQNINRQLTNTLQTLQTENINLRNNRSQLLLEESTWTTDTRIQQIAQQKLSMVLPKTQNILVAITKPNFKGYMSQPA
jgi:cell division protein FtsL